MCLPGSVVMSVFNVTTLLLVLTFFLLPIQRSDLDAVNIRVCVLKRRRYPH